MSRIVRAVALLLATGVLTACTGSEDPTSGSTTTTTSGEQWVVAVGDSYISGEGARWAGNTNGAARPVDALGPRAYAGRGCHRARTSEVEIGSEWRAANLACSGAVTADLGFETDDRKGSGQAAALGRFATKHDVGAVVVSIGGNDFGFASVVAQCATDFLTTVGQRHQLCRDDPEVRRWFTPDQRDVVAHRISTALRNIATAMSRAGYQRDDYALVVQTYPSPLPPGPRLRYAESVFERGFVGGCPFFSADATWANKALGIINATVRAGMRGAGLDNLQLLDLTDSLVGHRLCERGVGLFDAEVFRSWRDDGVADSVEWVNRVYTGARPWQLQESLHPNYWGVLAIRSELAALLAG